MRTPLFDSRSRHATGGHMPLLFTLILGTLAISTLVSPTRAGAATEGPALNGPEPSIQVQAQSSLQVAPDIATLRARLWEDTPAVNLDREKQRRQHAEARDKARKALEQRTAELIKRLEDQTELGKEAIKAGSLSVYPRREAVPTGSKDEDERLTRTRFERPVTVELDDLDRLEDVLGALMAAGANRLDGVTFDLKDRQAATDEALVQALEKARHKAELMATTLDTRLDRVLTIQETRSPGFAPRMMSVSADARGKAESSVPKAEYRPGTIEVEAGVNVEWSITPASSAGRNEAKSEAESEVEAEEPKA